MNDAKNAMIRLTNVSVKYVQQVSLFEMVRRSFKRKQAGAREWALHNIELNLKSGDSLAVIGRNGAGKTTLLKTMAQIYEPECGTVQTDGTIASLFDLSLGFLPEDSGRNNVYRKLLLMGHSDAEIRSLLPGIIHFSELEAYIDQPVESYSSGMRMRLAFATATAVKPDILLMDEWISTGDKGFVDKVTRRLDSFVDKCDIVVLASHSERLLKRVCNRAIVFDEGRLIFSGTVDDAVDYYNTDVLKKPAVALEPEDIERPRINNDSDDLRRAYFWLDMALKSRDKNEAQYQNALMRTKKFLKNALSGSTGKK